MHARRARSGETTTGHARPEARLAGGLAERSGCEPVPERRRTLPKRLLDPRHFADVVVASDPGLFRLRTASQATATAVVSFVVLAIVARRIGVPATSSLAGVMVAMMGCVLVQGPDPTSERATYVLLALPAAVALFFGTLLGHHAVWGSIVFVGVMFVAAYVRRFGARGSALGMIGWLAYFFALFLRAQMKAFPWMLASIGIALACGCLVRFVLLRERPDRTLRRALAALHARIRVLLGQLADAVESARPPRVRSIERGVARLNQTALELESQIETTDAGAVRPGLAEDALRAHVFEAELAAERVVRSAARLSASCAPTSAEREVAARALRETEHALRGEALRRRGAPEDGGGSRLFAAVRDDSSRELRWLTLALGELEGVGERLDPEGPPPPDFTSVAPAPSAGLATTSKDASLGIAAKVDPETRRAIQAAIAGGLAIVFGRLVSNERWYWAVIAAFIVFTQTQSMGETLVKAWHRVLGTIAGVGAGIVLAELVRGKQALEFALLFAGIFLSYYLLRVAYAWMILFLTTVLALLYALLGRSPTGLMELRLEETLVGAAIGALVAMFILPTPTWHRLRAAGSDVLGSLAAHLDLVARRLVDPAAGGELRAHARDLDAKLHELRGAAAPVTTRLVPRGPASRVRELALVSLLAYYARNLAALADEAAGELDAATREELCEATARLAREVEAVASAVRDRRPPETPSHARDLLDRVHEEVDPLDLPPSLRARPPRRAMLVHVLRSIDDALDDLRDALEQRLGDRRQRA